ncbi:MAG: replisome organizer, partial [Streptococcus anginosus]|nr:replisome organizer [Streptococcus anginosus]MDU1664546.1 replisome organizer [Peptoniphilus harei]
NVSLTDEEYGKLKDKMQGHRDKMIEKLSTYMQSTGRNYKDHYATLVHWYEQDKGKLKENSKSKVYTFEDYDKGEHL